ncbi:MAG: hypothetical protein GEU94_18590 [Micromonosporaceae bacterium]|nr:hypothetical protein [Micromonosporaceae bacterium]
MTDPSELTEAATSTREGHRLARQITGYAAIAGTLPYLTLKFAWLTGNDLGVTDSAFMRDTSIYALNLFTAGMDLYAIMLAVTFAHAWGQRMPAPLVLFPIWVGTGFLAPIIAGVPVVGAVVAIAGTQESGSGSEGLPLAPWVQPLVYGGFAWQGVFLLTAFLLYAKVRWARVFSARVDAAPSPVGRWAATGYAGVALGLLTAAVHLSRAFGSDLGLTPALADARTPTWYAVEGIHGLAALAGAAGLLMLARRTPPRWRFWIPVALAWIGAGAMFSWGFWSLVNVLGATLLAGGTSTADLALTGAQTLGGLLLATALLRHTSQLVRDTAGSAGKSIGAGKSR